MAAEASATVDRGDQVIILITPHEAESRAFLRVGMAHGLLYPSPCDDLRAF